MFEEWQKRQSRPSLCIFNRPVQALIQVPIQSGFSALQLRSLIEFAYEADHPAARFWRGENSDNRKYLGIAFLMRTTKLHDRITLLDEYVDVHSSKHNRNGAIHSYYTERLSSIEGSTPIASHRSEVSNLNLQQTQILSLLVEGGQRGVWTQDLAKIALKYSARISELRALGYSISVVERTEHGNNRYALKASNTVDANVDKLSLLEKME